MNESNPVGVPTNTDLSHEQSPQAPPVAPQQNGVPQHRVNELMSDALRRGYEKKTREIEAMNNQPAPQQHNLEEIRRMAREEADKAFQEKQNEFHKQQEMQQSQRVLNDISSKMLDAKTRYPDYDEKVGSLGIDKMPALLWHVSTVDNSADVLYDLAENKAKIAMLNGLPPHLIPGEIAKLSQSIKANQAADNVKLPSEPFGNIKPSSGVGVDKRASERTASEWRKFYKGKVS